MNTSQSGASIDRPTSAYPSNLSGEIDPTTSRWLWLLKWILAIPHYIILVFLWIAFLVTTVIAGFAVLFTGRYPRAIFDFNVGVLRWNWRVAFYAYSALATDKYPPFTLAVADYPADFTVDYPERLNNGLVLVKWWLLAIPHYIVLGAIIGSATAARQPGWSASLLLVLVIVAAIILLFRGRYPIGLFALILGINRWIYRVIVYAALMRDEYPPFRLDQGPQEPVGMVPAK